MKLQKLARILVFSAVVSAPLALSQDPGLSLPGPPEETKLPNGKLQRDDILKAERAQNIKDADALLQLAQSLKSDLEAQDRFVLSMDTLKKTDDIEKLAKKIRTRLRH